MSLSCLSAIASAFLFSSFFFFIFCFWCKNTSRCVTKSDLSSETSGIQIVSWAVPNMLSAWQGYKGESDKESFRDSVAHLLFSLDLHCSGLIFGTWMQFESATIFESACLFPPCHSQKQPMQWNSLQVMAFDANTPHDSAATKGVWWHATRWMIHQLMAHPLSSSEWTFPPAPTLASHCVRMSGSCVKWPQLECHPCAGQTLHLQRLHHITHDDLDEIDGFNVPFVMDLSFLNIREAHCLQICDLLTWSPTWELLEARQVANVMLSSEKVHWHV